MTRAASSARICKIILIQTLLVTTLTSGSLPLPLTEDDEDQDYAASGNNDAGLYLNEPQDSAATVTSETSGAWSEWSRWTECSRSCGMGISTSHRACKDEPCTGEATRYRICSKEECDEGSDDFRQLQCSRIPPRNGTAWRWSEVDLALDLLGEESSVDDDDDDDKKRRNQCALYCQLGEDGAAEQVAEKARDGTSCFVPDQYGICIDGTCQTVGCDKELYGTSKFDKCGVCKGNSESCQRVTGVFHPKPDALSEVVTSIPERSTKLVVVGDVDFDITAEDSNSSLLDAELSRQPPLPLEVAVEPNRTRRVYKFDGPLRRPVRILVKRDERRCPFLSGCSDSPSGGGDVIRYEYYRRRSVTWFYNDTSTPCSATCGSGFRMVRPICVTIESPVAILANSNCSEEGLGGGEPRPVKCRLPRCGTPVDAPAPPESHDGTRFYNVPIRYEHESRPEWRMGEWSRCSASCGGGVRRRETLGCVEADLYQRNFTRIASEQCAHLTRPATTLPCGTHPCPQWRAGPWGSCSATCGEGWRRRVVVCENVNSHAMNMACDRNSMPSTKQYCNLVPCHDKEDGEEQTASVKTATLPRWVASEWSECSRSCGEGGAQYRSLRCTVDGKQVSERRCVDKARPSDRRDCFLGLCPPFSGFPNPEDRVIIAPATATQTLTVNIGGELEKSDLEFLAHPPKAYVWKYEPWQPCSTTCGIGTSMSLSRCYHRATNQLSAEDRCVHLGRQRARAKSCILMKCPEPKTGVNGTRWEIGKFGQCSKTCGRGTRQRRVVCKYIPETGDETRPAAEMNELLCPSPKPTESEPCGLSECPPEWVSTGWSQCSKKCGRGFQEQQRECRQVNGYGQTMTVSPIFCPKTKKTRRPCFKPNCPPHYVAERWGPCRPPCKEGNGTQRRKVSCKRMAKGKLITMAAKHCRKLQKPIVQRSCKLRCSDSTGPLPEGLAVGSSRPPRPKVFVQRKQRQGPIFLTVPRRAVVLPGATIVARCNFKGVPASRVQWFHNRRRITARRGRVMVTSKGALRLAGIRSRLKGAYRCGDGKRQSKVLLVQVRGSAASASAPAAGSNVRLPPPPLQQRPPHAANSRLIRRRKWRRPSIANGDASADHRRVGHQDREAFGRRKSVDIEQSSRLNNLVIKSPPLPWKPPSHRSSSASAIDREQQFAAKKQKARVRWRSEHPRKKSVYDYGELPDIIAVRRDFTLGGRRGDKSKSIATQESGDDEGRGGGVSAEVARARRPTIEVHPTIEPMQDDATTIVTHVGASLFVPGHATATILCEANGEEPITYRWYKDDHVIRGEENDRIFVLQDGSLRMFQPRGEDSGNYVCMASNRYGNDSRGTDISVTFKPTINSTTEPVDDLVSDTLTVTVGALIRAKLGARLVIRCPSEGFPDPVFTWNKDGGGLRPRGHTIHANGDLEINPTVPSDQGTYACMATNPVDVDYQASTLILIDPPHVSHEQNVIPNSEDMHGLPELLNTGLRTPRYRMKANSSVIMGCPIAGFPEPTIEWLFEGRPVSEQAERLDYQLMFDSKALQIPVADNSTIGTYSCRGRNEGGELEISLRLNITIYKYAVDGMTECSESCGSGGMQRPRLVCLEDGVREMEDWYCTGIEKPRVEDVPCNRVDCPPRYYAEPWSECSVTCGNGTRHRAITCIVLMADGSMREVARATCEQQIAAEIDSDGDQQTTPSASTTTTTPLPIPVEQELCFRDPCPTWRSGEWRKCSKKCTGNMTGLSTRSVQCVSHNGTVVHKSMCKYLPKPEKKKNCTNPRCKPVWKPSKWSVCSASCGRNGIETRVLGCYYEGRSKQSAGRLCSSDTRPAVSRPCNRKPCNKLRCRDRVRICRRALVNRLPMCLNLKRKCCRTCR